MDIALEKGKSFDQGSSISQGTLCGPTEGDGPLAQKPMMLRGPIEPAQQEIDIHNLTHLPYMSWCPHCVATTRPNVAHKSSKVESTIPLVALDYCYVRDAIDQDVTTCLVARAFP